MAANPNATGGFAHQTVASQGHRERQEINLEDPGVFPSCPSSMAALSVQSLSAATPRMTPQTAAKRRLAA